MALRTAWCLVLLLCGPLGVAGAEPPPPEAPTEALRREAALAGLKSPIRAERLAAQRELIALLPGSRAAVLEAWKAGGEDLRTSLVDVVAVEGSPELLGLLLEAWCAAGEGLAARARGGLLHDPERTRAALAAARAAGAPYDGKRRKLADVDALLERDQVERIFLSRKSKTGSTGFYRGQYEALRPWRETALEVCLHIVLDRALRLPGSPAVGGYRFVRPMTQVIDIWEVRGMALNAVLDLARPDDVDVIRRLDEFHQELDSRSPWDDNGREDTEREALLDDLLATLYRLSPRRYHEQVRQRLDRLEQGRELFGEQKAAGLALQAGWFEEAIGIYKDQLRRSNQPAHDHYNLACAYALWSREPGVKDAEALRRSALLHLEKSVDGGWEDLAWMEQDRDLDPIRATPGYAKLVARIRANQLPR